MLNLIDFLGALSTPDLKNFIKLRLETLSARSGPLIDSLSRDNAERVLQKLEDFIDYLETKGELII